jgi:hypothetical protein
VPAVCDGDMLDEQEGEWGGGGEETLSHKTEGNRDEWLAGGQRS